MSFYRKPDWQGPFTIGMWQIRYDLGPEQVILFFRGGVEDSAVRPEHEWGVAILRNKVRDEAAERELLASPDLAGKIHLSEFARSPFLAVLGRDIDLITDRAREILAHDRSGVAGA